MTLRIMNEDDLDSIDRQLLKKCGLGAISKINCLHVIASMLPVENYKVIVSEIALIESTIFNLVAVALGGKVDTYNILEKDLNKQIKDFHKAHRQLFAFRKEQVKKSN